MAGVLQVEPRHENEQSATIYTASSFQ